jgi:two-component system chemotaxis sensor kinase CheA
VRSERGRGAAVIVTLPLEVYAAEVLVARAGGRAVGVPLQALERTVHLPTAGSALQRAVTGDTLAVDEAILPLVSLAAALGEPPTPDRFALVLRGETAAVAFGVEEVGAVTGVVPEQVPGVAARGALVTGLARLADGEPVELLDPRALVMAGLEVGPRPGSVASGAGPAPLPAAGLQVVLAEDSLSTREVLRVLLEGQGFAVRLAADGEEALARLRERLPDVLVTDVNMPRRDGLALTRSVRADPALARLPVILLTSQDDEASMRAGAEAGADAYLVKSKFNGEVLAATLARLGVGGAG